MSFNTQRSTSKFYPYDEKDTDNKLNSVFNWPIPGKQK